MPRQTRKAPNPVGADFLAKVAQIIVQIPTAVDLAAVIPSRFQQLGLTLIFQCPLAKRLTQPQVKAARMHSQHQTKGRAASCPVGGSFSVELPEPGLPKRRDHTAGDRTPPSFRCGAAPKPRRSSGWTSPLAWKGPGSLRDFLGRSLSASYRHADLQSRFPHKLPNQPRCRGNRRVGHHASAAGPRRSIARWAWNRRAALLLSPTS